MKIPAPFYALASAVLFAAGMPSEKWLLRHCDPVMLCGLLYISSGTGLSFTLLLQRIFRSKANKQKGKRSAAVLENRDRAGLEEVRDGEEEKSREDQNNSFNRRDLGWLISAIIVGGIFAPLLLLAALNSAKASSVALLLNFEIVITALIARFIFHEALGRRVVIGLTTVFLGGLCLSWSKDIEGSWSLLLAWGACVCWAADSNLTSQVRHIGPMQISVCKGLLAGSFSLGLAFILGSHLPDLTTIGGAAITGILSHGISLTCFVTAMRQIGAARAVAYVATEPFIAAILSVFFLHETVSLQMIAAGVLMGVGVWLHMTEKHPPKHLDGTIIASGLKEPMPE
jgi:drug/metabolite transporter (DMT)-like permease